jgi:tRNA nucleotidyltransferase (CCA-adding enzyme)
VETPQGSYNLAGTRTEVYDAPGELPRVSPASLDEDLRRRDFSVNAMAIGLTGDDLGHLYDPAGGLSDMDTGTIRVLHERSFLDDPTRLLRAIRYATRLGFELDPETERLAREAVAADALSTVSGARIRDELMDLLRESEAPTAIERMRDLEIHSALHPELDPDPELVASAALGAAAIGADPAVSALAALVESAPEELDLWLADLHLPAEERDAASRAARVAPRIAMALRERERSPSELRDLLGREPLEALALALALRAPSEAVLRWVTDLSGVGLEISGADLLAAGVPEGPTIGRALEETLRRKLDGLIAGRDQELETALLLAREPAQ